VHYNQYEDTGIITIIYYNNNALNYNFGDSYKYTILYMRELGLQLTH